MALLLHLCCLERVLIKQVFYQDYYTLTTLPGALSPAEILRKVLEFLEVKENRIEKYCKSVILHICQLTIFFYKKKVYT